MEGNWAGTYAYSAKRLHRPSTLEEVREVVAGAERIRVLGSRHSFSDIADSPELVSLDALAADVVVDRAAGTVSFGAAVTYGQLAQALQREGLALHNMASLPHISVAGAVATATHGSGDRNGNLATAVAALELVTSDGEVVAVRRGTPTSRVSWWASGRSARSRGSASRCSPPTRCASASSRVWGGMPCSSTSMR